MPSSRTWGLAAATVFLAIATLSLATFAPANRAFAGPGDVGTQAAEFALPEFPAGQIHTLGQHQGEVVLLFIIGYG